MFSFARTVMDMIQSATGLNVKPGSIDDSREEETLYRSHSTKQGKVHSPVSRVPHTLIENALSTFRHSIKAANSLESGHVSTTLIEEDFVFALQGYCANFTLRNKQEVLIRPILPNDSIHMKEVLASGEVSQQSLSFRFNAVTFTVKDSMLNYFTNINYDSHFAIIAMIKEEGKWKGVATARFIEDNENPNIAEWSAIVLDKYHGLGIGSCLLYYIAFMASQCGIQQLCAVVHTGNYPVLHWMKKLDAEQLFFRDCRYWFFKTPIYSSWVFDDDIRVVLEKSANGENSLNEECLDVLRQAVHELSQTELQQMKEELDGQVSVVTKKKKTVPKVVFVTSFEDDLDIGDLF